MGPPGNGRTFILIVPLLLVAVVVNGMAITEDNAPRPPLVEALKEIPGWELNRLTPLDGKMVEALDLDDYINAAYSDGRRQVQLYVGYYQSAMKIGAAHDPLVCFPGQGWVVVSRESGQVTDGSGSRPALSYANMLVQRGAERELVIYWFQTFDRTTTDTFTQKLHTLWHKIRHQRGDNAFVRVSVSVDDETHPTSTEATLSFVRSFYPVFVTYIRGGA